MRKAPTVIILEFSLLTLHSNLRTGSLVLQVTLELRWKTYVWSCFSIVAALCCCRLSLDQFHSAWTRRERTKFSVWDFGASLFRRWFMSSGRSIQILGGFTLTQGAQVDNYIQGDEGYVQLHAEWVMDINLPAYCHINNPPLMSCFTNMLSWECNFALQNLHFRETGESFQQETKELNSKVFASDPTAGWVSGTRVFEEPGKNCWSFCHFPKACREVYSLGCAKPECKVSQKKLFCDSNAFSYKKHHSSHAGRQAGWKSYRSSRCCVNRNACFNKRWFLTEGSPSQRVKSQRLLSSWYLLALQHTNEKVT